MPLGVSVIVHELGMQGEISVICECMWTLASRRSNLLCIAPRKGVCSLQFYSETAALLRGSGVKSGRDDRHVRKRSIEITWATGKIEQLSSGRDRQRAS